MPLSQTVAITCASASQMWFRARWLCLHICNMRKSTQLENLRELPGWAEILQWTRSNWGGGQIWGSCLRRGCALAWNTAQKQEAGWGNKVPNPQGWFSDLISEIWDSKSSPFLLPRLHSTVVPVVWDATVRHEPSWVQAGMRWQAAFAKSQIIDISGFVGQRHHSSVIVPTKPSEMGHRWMGVVVC